MGPNPLSVIKKCVDDIIVEHGSALIQEKHIKLLKEQLELLGKEKKKLEAEYKRIQKENDSLKEIFRDHDKSLKLVHIFGVLWDKDYKMRCVSCHKLLKYSSYDSSIVFCSDPKCNGKFTLRNKAGQKITEQEAIEYIQNSKHVEE